MSKKYTLMQVVKRWDKRELNLTPDALGLPNTATPSQMLRQWMDVSNDALQLEEGDTIKFV